MHMGWGIPRHLPVARPTFMHRARVHRNDPYRRLGAILAIDELIDVKVRA